MSGNPAVTGWCKGLELEVGGATALAVIAFLAGRARWAWAGGVNVMLAVPNTAAHQISSTRHGRLLEYVEGAKKGRFSKDCFKGAICAFCPLGLLGASWVFALFCQSQLLDISDNTRHLTVYSRQNLNNPAGHAEDL